MNYIEIKERVNEPSGFDFSYVIRADLPAKDQTFLSAESPVFEERSGVIHSPAGTSIEDVKARLVKMQQSFQGEVNARRRFDYFGLAYDGSKWTEVK